MQGSLDDNAPVVAGGDELPWFQDPACSKPFILSKTVDVCTDFSSILTVT